MEASDLGQYKRRRGFSSRSEAGVHVEGGKERVRKKSSPAVWPRVLPFGLYMAFLFCAWFCWACFVRFCRGECWLAVAVVGVFGVVKCCEGLMFEDEVSFV